MSKNIQDIQAKKDFTYYWDKFSTVSILLLLLVVFSIVEPRAFMSVNNFVKIIEQSSITILIGCGEFFAILLAGIDLSVGSVMALTGVCTAKMMAAGIHPLIAVLLGTICLGALIGFINGFLVNKTGLHPFIITIGTLSIFRGVTMIVANSRTVSGVPPEFTRMIGGRLFGVLPSPIIISLLAAGVLFFITMKTQFGRNLFAIGGNPQSAWYAGIHVKRHVLLAFMISGVCAGLAGMVNVARLGAAEPNAGTGYETFAIAAAVIGGTSFFGGIGYIPKVVIGGLIIGVINNGLNMAGVSSFYQQIAMGALIIVAVTLDRYFGASSKVGIK